MTGFPPYIPYETTGRYYFGDDSHNSRIENFCYTEEEEAKIDCDWIGLNNTIAGKVTEFKADWTDLNGSNGLSHFRFSTNNTGLWSNDTWTNSWSGNWSFATKTLNDTIRLIIAFRFFVNDSSGSEYASTICFFHTEEQQIIEQGIEQGGAGEGTSISVSYFIYVLNVLRSALTTREGHITVAVFGGAGFLLSMLIFRRKKERRKLKIKRVETS